MRSTQQNIELEQSARIYREIQEGIFTPIDHEFYINRQQILEQVVFGTVYKGISIKYKKYIAIRFISTNNLRNMPQQREIALLNVLANDLHPNIVQFYGHRRLAEGIYYFFELCEGGTLYQYITKRKQVNELKVCEMFEQLLEAMTYLNLYKIAHKDIKSQNILLDKQLNIKLSNFYFATQITNDANQYAGTPLYMAPQVIGRYQHDIRCDVWSAGLVLYELLTGQTYLTATCMSSLKTEIMKMKDDSISKVYYPVDIDNDWQTITNFMLVFDRKQRPYFKDIHRKFIEMKPELLKRIKSKAQI